MQREEELLVRFAATREAAAAEELARLCGPAIYATALGVLGNVDDAEDASQDAVLRLLRSAGTYRPGGSFRAWLCRIAVNAARGLLRAGRAAATARAAGEEAMRSKASEAPEELKGAVRAAVARLEEPQRTAVVLVYFQGLSRQEAAEILGLPVNTVSSTLARAKDKLRERLSSVAALAVGLTVESLEPLLGSASQLKIPAQVAARLRAAVRAEAEKAGLSAASAAKGGIAMKVVLGAVLAGALAGGAALLFGPPTAHRLPPVSLSSPPAAKGPPKLEHVASINADGELDGPAKEAIGYGGRNGGGLPDAEGNLWGGGPSGNHWLRASDGRVMTLASCEYGTTGFDCGKEGPIAGRPDAKSPSGYGWPCGGSALVGRPDSGGKTDGIYGSLALNGRLIRIWKNKAKDGRWWFEVAAGGGNAEAPRTKGQSADALAVKFKYVNMPQIGLDGKLRFMVDGAFYLLEDGKVTCILGPDDYKPATEAMKSLPCEGYVGGDGTFYLGGYYYSGAGAYEGKAAGIWRVTTDGKVEPYAKCNVGSKTLDGDALTQAWWFCGPHLGRENAYIACRALPPDAMLTSAHDEHFMRRIQKGRIASYCRDGEWREMSRPDGKTVLNLGGTVIAPNGFVYFFFYGESNLRLYRYTGVDFSKPAINKLEGGGK